MDARNYKIKELRLVRDWPVAKIANKYKLTEERVRQIIKEQDKKKIRKEIAEKYKKKFNDNITFNDLIQDIEILARPDRRKEKVIKRQILIRYLYDELDISFERIGYLLDKDHTSIMNLYYDESR